MNLQDLHLLVDDLAYPECPRWHEGKLWFSDMLGRRVYAVEVNSDSTEGVCSTEVEWQADVAGLGWDNDGQLMVVSAPENTVLKLQDGKLQPFADLSALSQGECNDMIVKNGVAYVGHFNGKLSPQEVQPSGLIKIDTEGNVSIALEGVMFPNGMVFSADGKRLIFAESFGRCLSQVDVAEDGSLSNKRPFADLGTAVPDGICIDAEGAVWVTDPLGKRVIRVLEGGEVTDSIDMQTMGAFACELGGSDGKTLFICAADGFGKIALNGPDTGKIYACNVNVPAQGC
ncbi:SMP-30/gluconolactonase/LRE family protein [Maricurvus nonylphenolicus]|uniref:SMP-30/gluconolactonase/LRE family protein n=1 Tax=Maricurvus nonylphenolicus TaxID=1008307 RepID=UPI0036F21C93